MKKLDDSKPISEDLGNQGFDEENAHLETFVRSVPKVELHVHLDGTFEPQNLWDHLVDHPELIHCFPVDKQLPWTKPEEPPLPLREMIRKCETPLDYRRLCTCRRRYENFRLKEVLPDSEKSPPGTLEDMLTCFEFFFPLVFDNIPLIESLAHDFVERQYEQNVIYTEVRYSPHLLAKDPFKALEAVTRGLRRGCQKFGVDVNQIMCAINFSPDWSQDIVHMADKFRSDFPCAVVGIDIAAGEDHFSPESSLWHGHFGMCQRAKELGINITLHAGETPESAENVRKAILEYGATRVGHGYRITKHPEIVDIVKSNNTHLEVCPTSSVETGGWKKTEWTKHPGSFFRDNGISISLNSDDPAVFNTSLTVSVGKLKKLLLIDLISSIFWMSLL
jgi:adenosine deaminase